MALQSGSNGNCLYVEADGVRLLFDAGLCGREARSRLKRFGRDIRQVQAVIVSHDHSDHVRCAGVYQRMFGLPVYLTGGTLEAARQKVGRLRQVCRFRAGETLRFGAVSVSTIPTPHDAAEGVAFVVSGEGKRLGILTDLGHPFEELGQVVAGLDGLFLESNYDPDMLDSGPYPTFLKQRIRGAGGHISNVESAELLAAHAPRTLRWACLAHLSEVNNTPEIALRTHRGIWAGRVPVHVASRHHPTGPLRL